MGDVNFLSLSTHKGYEASRRDDLETLGFILLYFVTGDLPWNLPHPTKPEK
jgi:hypothetical protein